MIIYYLWIKTKAGNYQATGSLHGYQSIEQLKSEIGNKSAMRLYAWVILKAKICETSNDSTT